jgi:membrane protein DedA with SNARE-associated domain
VTRRRPDEPAAAAWIRNNTLLIVLAFWFVFLIFPHISPWEGANDNLRVFQRFNRWLFGHIEELFADHGYWVVGISVLLENSMFLGLFVPGAIILILAGLSAENGSINIWYVFGLAIAATITGDTLSYFIGRMGWARALERTSMGTQIEKIRERMEAHTTWIILVYHFAGYSRMIGPAAAGIFRIPYRRWAPLDYLGGTLWVFAFTMAGVVLGLAGVEFSDTKTVVTVIEWVLFGLLVLMVLWVYGRAARGGGGERRDDGEPGPSRTNPVTVPVDDP